MGYETPSMDEVICPLKPPLAEAVLASSLDDARRLLIEQVQWHRDEMRSHMESMNAALKLLVEQSQPQARSRNGDHREGETF